MSGCGPSWTCFDKVLLLAAAATAYCLWMCPEALCVPCSAVGQKLRVTFVGGSITEGGGAVGEVTFSGCCRYN